LSYGDGLFETLLVRDGSPCQWSRHWGRLGQGSSRLGMPLPTESLVTDEIAELLRGSRSGVLRLTVTRGDGGRGYSPPADACPRRILSLYATPEYPSAWAAGGVVIRMCRTPATENPALAGLKHLNRLDSVLARAEWSDPGIAEGLMAGPGGDIIGGTMTNLFLWDGAGLKTPPIDRCGVAGTVRALAVELAARLGIACVETRLYLDDLLGARGLFLTNSVLGVWPVRRLDAHDYDPEDLPLDLIRILRQDAQTPGGGS
jgi:4-amino-4-deoxychorismate lyase